ncbi:MAG: DUF3427 domain-containing protein [Acidaminococcaceae bacterium]|nr:DUF3427 domain-containing protein [Acidaminococcaceae bacterium]
MDDKKLSPGFYEQVINEYYAKQLEHVDSRFKEIESIDQTEASSVLSSYLKDIVTQGLESAKDTEETKSNTTGIQRQIVLANKIIKLIQYETKNEELAELLVDKKGEELLTLLDSQNTIRVVNANAKILRPQTSLTETSLFTGAKHEPQMYSELKAEISTCDRIDMLVSFVKWSGLSLLLDSLKEFTHRGGQLRIITTSYLGATDYKAIEVLNALPNVEIKISYDTKRTRLHAKAYIFHRATGFTTAYIGSSNMSNPAMSSGLEWNVKITEKDLSNTMNKVLHTFDAYWHSPDFDIYNAAQKERLKTALYRERFQNKPGKQYLVAENPGAYHFKITPYPYQQEILDEIEAERTLRANYKNLIVAATGTGKTVIAAFDYKRFCKQNPGQANKLLFIAHREEILSQSLSCFRGILEDENFGDLFVGSHRPTSQVSHLFMSIQTFNSQDWTSKTSPDFYDYIIIDEFHHAAASSYQKLLNYYKPKIWLGLTATPERMDGKNVAEYFNNRITSEIRLPEAIERKLLCPFHYFGVSDGTDLSGLTWSRGGYDIKELNNVYVLNAFAARKRATLVVQAVRKYTADLNLVHGVGFCVSIEHAIFMNKVFNEEGIPSICLTGGSSDEERNTARSKLISGEIKFIFVVDLYNEGVDIPEIDTILFLRPTESLTIFLQQLGRGLRLAEDKECLTVLDFIGQSHKKYRFDEKFTALLHRTRKGLYREIEQGFISLPAGCYIQLEKQAQSVILKNIKDSLITRTALIEKLRDYAQETKDPITVGNFADYYHISLLYLYSKTTFSSLCVAANLLPPYEIPEKDYLAKALPRIATIDSRRWLQFLLDKLPSIANWKVTWFSELEKRMIWMFYFTFYQTIEAEDVPNTSSETLSERDRKLQTAIHKLQELSQYNTVWEEMISVLEYNLKHITFVDDSVDVGFDCPLDLHCHYTRDQLFAALDYLNPSNIRQGVKWLPDKKIDVLINTLIKSEKDYSPSTMYNDYSINENLFHWQSQSTTSEASPTGQRYINHKKQGSKVLLFVREYGENEAKKAAPFMFLGLAEFVQNEGSRPMNIIWRLEKPIPASMIQCTNKLVL